MDSNHSGLRVGDRIRMIEMVDEKYHPVPEGSTGTITGFTILDCSNETPGLGQKSKKPEFMSRFSGKSGELTVDKYSNDGQNIQAITAATITSKAVVKAVNTATEAFGNLTGGASNG